MWEILLWKDVEKAIWCKEIVAILGVSDKIKGIKANEECKSSLSSKSKTNPISLLEDLLKSIVVLMLV